MAVSELPELFDRGVKARSLAYTFAAGAVLGLLTLVFPHEPEVMDGEMVGLATLALAVAGLVRWRNERTTGWELHAVVALGTLIVTLANHFVGASALYPIMYSWPVLYAFYFFPLRQAAGHLALVAAAYAVLLAIQDPSSPVVRWLLAVGTPAVAGLLISRLLRRVMAERALASEHSRALKQSESRTRLVLDSAPDAFLAVDRDGVVTTWNVAAERMFGWSAAEAVGRPLRGLIFPPEGREAHDSVRHGLLEGDEPLQLIRRETELQRRDGSRFPAENTVSRVRIGDEVVMSGFIRDLSDRRRREEEQETLLREQVARGEAERTLEVVAGMQELVDAALEHRRLGDILSHLLPRVQQVLGADAATIFLADEERLRLAASTKGAPPAAFEPVAFGEGFGGRVAQTRSPLLVHEPPRDDILDPALRALDVRSLIGVPLLAEGEVTGVIVAAAERPRDFRWEDLGKLSLAADKVALAIQHARVFEREHRIAETLQRSLLPERLPQRPGLAVAARYRPAATEAEVGGDWYDVIPVPGGGVGLVMGDVAGKGLAAASMVGRLRSALRAYALEGHAPAAVVEQLNRLVWTELEESQMATLLYVVLDPAEGTVAWVNAGHLPPLMVVGERLAHFLEGDRSVPLGVLPFPSFEENSVRIEPGGAVVLYTDGLVERPGEHIDEGLERLAGIVRDAPAEPERLCDYMLEQLVPADGAPDDVALLALQNLPMGDTFKVELPTQPEALASMRSLLRRWLGHAEGSEQEIAEITTACGEAATNAIEHAGAGGSMPFEVGGRLEGREIQLTVRDFGSWRAPREGDQGRGLSLMRALMDSVEVEPGGEGTTVTLRRRLDGNGGPP